VRAPLRPVSGGRFAKSPKRPPATFYQPFGLGTPEFIIARALSWLLTRDDLIVIPKTSRRERLKENLGALEHPLTPPQLAELECLFPPPSSPSPLEML
jgi:hypothetical protein